jgi:hypothetical protein
VTVSVAPEIRLASGVAVELPCRMVAGSRITVVAGPRPARAEGDPRNMVSQFMVELPGTKVVSCPPTPNISLRPSHLDGGGGKRRWRPAHQVVVRAPYRERADLTGPGGGVRMRVGRSLGGGVLWAASGAPQDHSPHRRAWGLHGEGRQHRHRRWQPHLLVNAGIFTPFYSPRAHLYIPIGLFLANPDHFGALLARFGKKDSK